MCEERVAFLHFLLLFLPQTPNFFSNLPFSFCFSGKQKMLPSCSNMGRLLSLRHCFNDVTSPFQEPRTVSLLSMSCFQTSDTSLPVTFRDLSIDFFNILSNSTLLLSLIFIFQFVHCPNATLGHPPQGESLVCFR